MTPLFQLKNVFVDGPRRPRLEGVTVDILPGRTAVVGASGAGKTSLLNLLSGFETPDAGGIETVQIRSERVPIFWSPADGGLWPGVSIADHIRLVTPGASTRGRVQEWLERFDLNESAARHVEELSAGERSRLSLARALAVDAAVLVLDEPLVHVDRARLERYWSIVRETCEARGTSLVFSSHHMIDRRHADRVVGMEKGRVVLDCSIDEALRESVHE
ncbi:Fe(3+) ions import ATP-binding protein FbpC [Caulifigura coniformis]|uniref:Fe(3+) ions import ATP-binding protein FbpC n=1 Tax=Caulifigura coniformis TaxID=2527983 RepID=A0A517SDG5_9PLAN|nr:ATP-binding cassette domain-containing protein [Caulifigura coniformis]QDT54155.1 Fe(3+) ions import ATP-binding protein FbpC [Caulifigura coniformis]